MKKKGAIWVSAILYIVIGIIAITLILNAGLPLINRMRDRNIVSQTTQVLDAFDQKVRFVANQGPGALEPFYVEIKNGELIIDENQETIIWNMKTEDRSQEPGVVFEEGNLATFLNETIIKNEYLINIYLDYSNRLNISLTSDAGNVLKGPYQLSIRHTGVVNNLPVISIEVA